MKFNLGTYHRKITCSSKEVNKWFDKGLAWNFAFNHEESIYCFSKALELDSNCLMALWGLAYSYGPNYNNLNLPYAQLEAISQSIQKAREIIQNSKISFDKVEIDLIEAISKRSVDLNTISAFKDELAWTLPYSEVEKMNIKYSDSMKELYQKYKDDFDIGVLFGESLMMLNPWKLWTNDGIVSSPNTQLLIDLFDDLITKQSKNNQTIHPGLCHYYIHALEQSNCPEKALEIANQLRDLVPDAGHLCHMPSHIDVLLGDYSSAILANQKAIKADIQYLKYRGNRNFYTLYRLHDYHLLIYAAMLSGNYSLSLSNAMQLTREIPIELLLPLDQGGFNLADLIESFFPIYIHVYIRFGKWNEIINDRIIEDYLEKYDKTGKVMAVSKATLFYGRSIAYAALNDLVNANKQKEKFIEAFKLVPKTRTLHNNISIDLFAIAEQMIYGEIKYREGAYDEAFNYLRKAVYLDDHLPYDEPWGWMVPARHALGALLLEQNRVDESFHVYIEDLIDHPYNVWALKGLLECFERGQSFDLINDYRPKDLANDNKKFVHLPDTYAQFFQLVQWKLQECDVDVEVSCLCRFSRHKNNNNNNNDQINNFNNMNNKL